MADIRKPGQGDVISRTQAEAILKSLQGPGAKLPEGFGGEFGVDEGSLRGTIRENPKFGISTAARPTESAAEAAILKGLDPTASAREQLDIFRETAPQFQEILEGILTKSREAAARREFKLFQELAPKFAQEQQDIINELFPEQAGLGEILAADVSERLQADEFPLPKGIENLFKRASREAFSSRGLLASGESGRAEAETLASLGLSLRGQDVGTALALKLSIPQVTIPTNIPGEGFSAIGPNTIPGTQNFQAALQGALGLGQLQQNEFFKTKELGLKGTELNQIIAAMNKQNQGDNLFGTVLGSIVGSIGGPIGSAIGSKIGGGIQNLFGGGDPTGGGVTSFFGSNVGSNFGFSGGSGQFNAGQAVSSGQFKL